MVNILFELTDMKCARDSDTLSLMSLLIFYYIEMK